MKGTTPALLLLLLLLLLLSLVFAMHGLSVSASLHVYPLPSFERQRSHL